MLRCLTHPEEPPEETADMLLRGGSGRPAARTAGRERGRVGHVGRCVHPSGVGVGGRARMAARSRSHGPRYLGWCRTSVRHRGWGHANAQVLGEGPTGLDPSGATRGRQPVARGGVRGDRGVRGNGRRGPLRTPSPGRTRAASAAARPDFWRPRQQGRSWVGPRRGARGRAAVGPAAMWRSTASSSAFTSVTSAAATDAVPLVGVGWCRVLTGGFFYPSWWTARRERPRRR